MKRQLSHYSSFAVLIATALLVSSCSVSRSPVTGKKRAYGYSWQQEIEIGKNADPQIIAQYGLYDNKELADYVIRVGEEVLAKSDMRRADQLPEYKNTEFFFRVLDSPVVNAFALPGGYIYVTRGLLAHLENEAQLAVVIGHEIGHVAARHGSQRAFEGQLGQLGVIAGAIGGAVAGMDPNAILQAGSQASQLLFLKYGRDDELESDRLGVEWSALNGYQAGLGSKFFQSLKRISVKSGQSIPSFMSSHPDPGQREVKIQEMAAKWDETLDMEKIERKDYLEQIDGLVVGDDPRQGYVENNKFYHPGLKFQFPTPNFWAVINQPTQVVMVEKDQKAIMAMTIISDAASPREAATKVLGEAQEQGSIKIVNSADRTVNGMQAFAVLARTVSQQQQGQQAQPTADYLIYFIQKGENIFQFLGYSETSTMSQYQTTFQSTMEGFANLSDPSKINRKPNRLKVARASKNGSFKSFVPSALPADLTDEDLAIINQVELNTAVKAGSLIKLIGQ